jgi:hypothetical protein
VIYVLFLSAAFAGTPPERPATPEPIEGECGKTVGITLGRGIPDDLVDGGGNATCSAVVVPLSDYADLLQAEAWGESIAAFYVIDVAHLQFERDWFREELMTSREPQPFWNRPAVMMGSGVVAGVSVVLSAAYALQALD